jgi:hypothetical protein
MAMLMKVIMVERERTGMSAQRRVSRARGTEEGAPRGIHTQTISEYLRN